MRHKIPRLLETFHVHKAIAHDDARRGNDAVFHLIVIGDEKSFVRHVAQAISIGYSFLYLELQEKGTNSLWIFFQC